MSKCDINKVAKQTSGWVFSCKFAAYLQNTAASVNYSNNYSKFRYPTLTKILVCWLVERYHMVTKYIPCSTRVVLLNKTSVSWLGRTKLLK